MKLFKKKPKRKSNIPPVRGLYRGHNKPHEGEYTLIGKPDQHGVCLWRRVR